MLVGGEVGWVGGGVLSRKCIVFFEMIAFIGLQIAGRRGSCEARKPGGWKAGNIENGDDGRYGLKELRI